MIDEMEDNIPAMTLDVLVDDYFNQDDGEDCTPMSSGNDTLLCLNDTHSEQDQSPVKSTSFKWQFRHTISYWIAIWYLVGGLFFVIGSATDVYRDIHGLADDDYYTLNTVSYFVGGLANLVAGFWGYKQVMSEPSGRYHRSKHIYCLRCNHSLHFWASFLFLISSVVSLIPKTFAILHIRFEPHSLTWLLVDKLTMVFVVVCLLLGGAVQMHLNKYWRFRPYKLGWIIAWLNGIGGLAFFVPGVITTWIDDAMVTRWLNLVPFCVGSVLYTLGAVLMLGQWKLRQFGLVNLPFLNRAKHRTAMGAVPRDKVLYRDVLFLCVYCVTAVEALLAISFAAQCGRFSDWVKNFSLAEMSSIAILCLGSFMHREPKRAPFVYFIWFIRAYMTMYTVNLGVDLYHLTHTQCAVYGAHS